MAERTATESVTARRAVTATSVNRPPYRDGAYDGRACGDDRGDPEDNRRRRRNLLEGAARLASLRDFFAGHVERSGCCHRNQARRRRTFVREDVRCTPTEAAMSSQPIWLNPEEADDTALCRLGVEAKVAETLSFDTADPEEVLGLAMVVVADLIETRLVKSGSRFHGNAEVWPSSRPCAPSSSTSQQSLPKTASCLVTKPSTTAPTSCARSPSQRRQESRSSQNQGRRQVPKDWHRQPRARRGIRRPLHLSPRCQHQRNPGACKIVPGARAAQVAAAC